MRDVIFECPFGKTGSSLSFFGSASPFGLVLRRVVRSFSHFHFLVTISVSAAISGPRGSATSGQLGTATRN